MQPGAGGNNAVRAGVGAGGINRGPGHATLEMNHRTEGGTDALQAQKLPPGRAVPTEWEVLQVSRSAPQAGPQRPAAAGGEAAAGAGQAAWQRRLAPSHREVVRSFFAARRGEGGR